MKKVNKLTIACSALFAGLAPYVIQGAAVTLFSLTPYTYATSTHGDNYSADTYYGFVSVRGADRLVVGTSACYPTYSEVTYNVQGTIYQRRVYSQGKNDQVVRTDSITVKDLWNTDSKTQVYGGYGYGETGEAIMVTPDENQ